MGKLLAGIAAVLLLSANTAGMFPVLPEQRQADRVCVQAAADCICTDANHDGLCDYCGTAWDGNHCPPSGHHAGLPCDHTDTGENCGAGHGHHAVQPEDCAGRERGCRGGWGHHQ